jgi:3-oxoacyl-[acyl-carrier-protein] synthase-1
LSARAIGRRRVVISGMGGVASVGTGLPAIDRALRSASSGLRAMPEWAERGIASLVGGPPEPSPECPLATKRFVRTSTSVGRMALYAAWEALTVAGLDPGGVAGERIGAIIGSGTGSTLATYEAADLLASKKSIKRLNPFTVCRVMGSTTAAHVAVALGITGENWSISSACSTGAHAIGMAALMIRHGYYDRMLAGGADELDWTRAGAFDAMRALSRGYNDRPAAASRPFDASRDGFVISGGAGVVLLEDLDSARERGAPVLAEVAGYGANSDGHDLFAPTCEGSAAVMRLALADAEVEPAAIDYVNAHGTSTPQGDPSEAAAMREVFGDRQPRVSSTKSLTGHAVGAAGSLETIFTVLMMRGGPSRPGDGRSGEARHAAGDDQLVRVRRHQRGAGPASSRLVHAPTSTVTYSVVQAPRWQGARLRHTCRYAAGSATPPAWMDGPPIRCRTCGHVY